MASSEYFGDVDERVKRSEAGAIDNRSATTEHSLLVFRRTRNRFRNPTGSIDDEFDTQRVAAIIIYGGITSTTSAAMDFCARDCCA